MLYNLTKTLLLISLLVLVNMPIGDFKVANAQISLPGVTSAKIEQMVLKISPTSPGPGQTVTAEVTSTAVDLSRSSITWTLNEKPITTSGSATKISITAPPTVGAKTSITATARTNDGQTITREQTFSTAALDLLWEAESYTPPFYKGKKLPAAGSSITVTVLPDLYDKSGSKLPPNELVYTWKQGSLVVSGVSGRGRSTATFPGPEFYKSFDVIVEVSSTDQSVNALGRLTLEPVSPMTLLYESHPTLGIRFERTLTGTVELPGGEIVVSAQPFFFGSEMPSDDNIRYIWSLNGAEVQNPSDDGSTIVFRAEGEGGRAEIGLSTEHLTKVFQQAQKSLSINFAGAETP